MSAKESKFTDAAGLLATLWDDASRPSRRWLMLRKREGRIPFTKVGGRVFFDPQAVRAALQRRGD